VNGWRRLSAPGNKCGARWRHWSGWEVHHCGHPTANWPYLLLNPKNHTMFVSANGLGFKTLAAAQGVVAGIAAGIFHLDENDNRVKNATAFGDFL